MVVLGVIILFIFCEPPEAISRAVNSYCSLPCPFMYPAPSPWPYGGLGPLRRPQLVTRSGFSGNEDNEIDYEDQPEAPPPTIKSRFQAPGPDPIPPTASPSTPPPSKPKPAEDPDPQPPPSPNKKKSQPQINPRRFFTSLFSIPGAVVDTMISGEIVI